MQEKIAYRSFHNFVSTAAVILCQIMACWPSSATLKQLWQVKSFIWRWWGK